MLRGCAYARVQPPFPLARGGRICWIVPWAMTRHTRTKQRRGWRHEPNWCRWVAGNMPTSSRLCCDGGDGCVCLPIRVEFKRLAASKLGKRSRIPRKDNDINLNPIYQAKVRRAFALGWCSAALGSVPCYAPSVASPNRPVDIRNALPHVVARLTFPPSTLAILPAVCFTFSGREVCSTCTPAYPHERV